MPTSTWASFEIRSREAIRQLTRQHPVVGQIIAQSYAYVVFARVRVGFNYGGFSTGGYGNGLLFEQGQPVGSVLAKGIAAYSGIQIIAFENREAVNRMKMGELSICQKPNFIEDSGDPIGKAVFSNGVMVLSHLNEKDPYLPTIVEQKLQFSSSKWWW